MVLLFVLLFLHVCCIMVEIYSHLNYFANRDVIILTSIVYVWITINLSCNLLLLLLLSCKDYLLNCSKVCKRVFKFENLRRETFKKVIGM